MSPLGSGFMSRWPIRTALYALVLCAICPALAVISAYGVADYREHLAATRDQTLNLAKAMALQQQMLTENTRVLLHTLSRLPEVAAADAPAMHELFRGLLEVHANYSNISYVDMQGGLVSSSHRVTGPVTAHDRKYFLDAVRTRQFSAGEYVVGRVVKHPIFQFSAPVFDSGGSMRAVLVATMKLDRYDAFLAGVALPLKWRLTILDHQGIRLYRFPKDDAVAVGTPGLSRNRDILESIASDEGIFTAVDPDGVHLVYAFMKMRLAPEGPPYMTIVVGLPQATLAQALAVGMGPALLLMLAVLGLALLTARFLGSRAIGEGLDRLSDAARALTGGNLEARTGDIPSCLEIRELGQAFDQMAETLSRDSAERARTEAVLRQATAQAESANRAKSAFLANMSHEIRTPLNGIMGCLHLLKNAALKPEYQEFTEMGLQSGSRLTRLLSDILDLSRIEAGKLGLAREPFLARDLLDTVRQSLDEAARAKGLEFTLDLDPAVPPCLVGDVARLRQVLFNLAGNAIKFTTAGSVRVEMAPAPESSPARPLFLIRVRDTGMGIPEDQREAIFEPFTQADGSLTRQHQGAGLGLSIVRRLMDLLGGTLTMESAVGQGTAFTCLLPLDLPEAGLPAPRPESARSAPSAVPPGPLRILLAEDERINQTAIKRHLENNGHAVTAVGTGREVLNTLAGQDFDLILMDIQMPEMDGVRATRAIRDPARFGPKSRIPVIALTAYAMAGDRETFLAAGMDGYLAKPLDMDELEETLSRAGVRGEGWAHA